MRSARLGGSPRVLGAAALALALPGLWIDRPSFFAAWLAAWWLALGVVLGALGQAWVHRLTGGRWGEALRPATALLARRMPWVLLLFLPLLLGLDTLYPALRAGPDDWRRAMAQPAFNRLWFQPGFFALRLVLYGLVWAWLARPASWRSATRGRAAGSLLLHAIVTSLAAIDLLMALQPLWFSTVFGLLVLTGQLLAGAALAIALTAACPPATVTDGGAPRPPPWRDFGNLLLAWMLSWAYLAFVQLLIIWAENLPREIAWYLPRLQTGWRAVGIALVVLGFALPLLALLMRALKDRPRRLAAIAGVLLAAQALDAAWLVLPSVAPASPHGAWLAPLLMLGMGGLLFGDAPARLRAQRSRDDGEWRDARASA